VRSQTFACDEVPGTGLSYLRADYRERCYTMEHHGYMAYAVIMACIFTLGIPAVYMQG
jgi:hypothetical protein